MSKVGEFILKKLSRDPKTSDYVIEHYEKKHRDVNVCMLTLQEAFPNIKTMIADRKVLDIGCAEGMETLALSLMGADRVYGIDIRIDDKSIQEIQQKYPNCKIIFSIMDAHNTSFLDGEFDVVVTCGSFEHFYNPYLVLKECRRILKDNGVIFLTSGVWAHPWGAHMNFFTKVPWVQFVFSESTIMNVRRSYRNDGATKFNEVEGGLNKIGIRSITQIIKELDLKIEYLKLNPVKSLTPFTKVPFINELFTNKIIAIIKK